MGSAYRQPGQHRAQQPGSYADSGLDSNLHSRIIIPKRCRKQLEMGAVAEDQVTANLSASRHSGDPHGSVLDCSRVTDHSEGNLGDWTSCLPTNRKLLPLKAYVDTDPCLGFTPSC
jgi:hypothetical protein